MKIKVPYYYKDFKCIASDCPDTCCAGWEIIIDDESYEKYKKIPGEFGKTLNSKITFYEDKEPGFLLDKENCPFLNKNLLCDIYSNLGEDYLCHTCKTFPRIIQEYGSLREICLSLSCPEAARLILKDNKKLTFDISENDEFVTTFNNISPDLYIQILNARNVAFNIINNSSIDFNKRLAILLMFSHDIQEKIDSCKISEIAAIRKNYCDANFINELCNTLDKYKNNEISKYNHILKIMNIFEELEQINDSWPKIIEADINMFYKDNSFDFYATMTNKFDDFYKNNIYEYENLISYFIYRYFMKSLFDADLYSKVCLGVMSFLIIKDLDICRWINNNYELTLEDQIDIMHMYSKEIEHSDNNIEKLYELFNKSDVFTLKNVFISILN